MSLQKERLEEVLSEVEEFSPADIEMIVTFVESLQKQKTQVKSD